MLHPHTIRQPLLALLLIGLAPHAESRSTKGCGVSAAIMSESSQLTAAENVQLSASVTGAESPVTLAWDLNGDGMTDAEGTTVTTHFPTPGAHEVTLTVTDASDCVTSTTATQSVVASQVVIDEVGPPTELCGDGDLDVEPGERFAIPVTFENVGSASGTDVHALFARATASANKLTLGPDLYGYTLADQDESTCRLDFLDISSTAAALDIDLDDAGVVVDLEADGVTLYGETFQQLVVSDNGYLSTDITDDGSDFFVTCPLPSPPRFAAPATRVYAFWDDLLLFGAGSGQGKIYYQYFDRCPRTADRGATDGCHVFQWDDASYGSGGPRNLGQRDDAKMKIQAIFYDGSNDLVLQKIGDDPVYGRDAVMGILNDTGNDGLGYRCELPKGPQNSVCLFAPSATATPPLSTAGVRLETPAVALGDVAPDAAMVGEVRFALEQDFVCGDRLGIDYLGAVGVENFSDTGSALAIEIATGNQSGSCDSTTICAIDDASAIVPENGLLFNERRPGNGADIQFVGTNVALLWYTATPAHRPIWYFNADRYRNNQVTADIKRFHFGGTFVSGDPSSETVGQSVMTWLDADRMIYWWELGDQRSAELMSILRTSSEPTDSEVTAQWYSENESGWGVAFNRQGETEVQTTYLYDESGNPVWLLSGATSDEGVSELKGYRWVHCPGCPWVTAEPHAAGTLDRSFDGEAGTLSTDIILPAPMSGSWHRDQLSIRKIN